ncbi:MAG: FAD-binding oxidoreductase [Rhizobiaceae bacterium]
MVLSLLHANDEPGEHAPSWYAASAHPISTFEPLKGEQIFDVAIIGGGYSGLSAALHLAQNGYKVALLEAHRIGWGASGRNGGQVSSGQGSNLEKIESLVGRELAKQIYRIGIEAGETVRTLVKTHAIDCALGHGVIGVNHRKRYDADSKSFVEKMQRDYGSDTLEYLTPDAMCEKLGATNYSGGSLDKASFHLHPLNFARGIARVAIKAGVTIFEQSEVLSAENCEIKTASGSIKCNWTILACNGYIGNLNPQAASRVMPINNFIIATEPLDDKLANSLIKDREAVYDSRFVVNYFRLSEDNRMLFGGGENYGYRFPKDIKAFVRPNMLEIFPQLKNAKIDYGWGGTLGITLNRLPLFEVMPDNILNISGYSGDGIAMATMAGKIAAEAIDGQMSRFDIMAKLPTPKFPGGPLLRWPTMVAAMVWYSLRDRI